MQYDYSKLLGKIIVLFGSRENFAKEMGMSPRTLYDKLNGKSMWDQAEMAKALNLIGEPHEMIQYYFFDMKVLKSEL